MSTVTIVPARGTIPAVARAATRAVTLRERDFEGFFQAPFACYPEGLWASPLKQDLAALLDPKRNPFFAGPGEGTYFTAWRGGLPVGRIAAHVHHASNRRYGVRRGSFGFFECVDDPDVALRLLDAAGRWVASRECTELAGCFDLTAVQEMGVVTAGFGGEPYTAMRYNLPHIPRLLAAGGFEPFFPMSTWEIDLDGLDPDALLGPAGRALDRDESLTWSRVDRRGLARHGHAIRELLNDGFRENAQFVSINQAEFDFQARGLTLIMDPRINVLVEEGGRPAGVCVCIPDLNPFLRATRSRVSIATPLHYLRHLRRRRRAVIVFGAVTPDLQNRGLGGVLLARVVRALQAAGYEQLGITWVSSENGPSLRFMQKLGARRLHSLSLFRKEL
jgi:GNAT superfamily N-acetyltransferase